MLGQTLSGDIRAEARLLVSALRRDNVDHR